MIKEFLSYWESFKGQELKGRDQIIKSFCPDIFGCDLVKLAIMLVLAGGIYLYSL